MTDIEKVTEQPQEKRYVLSEGLCSLLLATSELFEVQADECMIF